MPVIPKEVFRGRLRNVLENNKKTFLIYSVFYLLAIEIVSYFLVDNKNYLLYWYPLLNNTGFFILITSIALLSNKLNFCARKKIALFCLSAYYLLGTFAIIFQFPESIYFNLVKKILLGATILIMFYSFKTEK